MNERLGLRGLAALGFGVTILWCVGNMVQHPPDATLQAGFIYLMVVIFGGTAATFGVGILGLVVDGSIDGLRRAGHPLKWPAAFWQDLRAALPELGQLALGLGLLVGFLMLAFFLGELFRGYPIPFVAAWVALPLAT